MSGLRLEADIADVERLRGRRRNEQTIIPAGNVRALRRPRTLRHELRVPSVLEKGSIHTVLFDLDQTLTDRPASIALMARRWLEEFGFLLPGCTVQQISDCIHAGDRKGYQSPDYLLAGMRDNLPWRTPPQPNQLLEFWQHVFPRCAVPRPGTATVLQRIASSGYKIGVVTNGYTGPQNSKLDVMGLRPFLSCVVVSETVGVQKPAPRIYQIALDGLQARAPTTAFVGDNPQLDVLAPRKLGMTPIWLKGTYPWPANEIPPEHTIQSLEDLIELLPA
jgi:putative hydrolase of the HAD superfamily